MKAGRHTDLPLGWPQSWPALRSARGAWTTVHLTGGWAPVLWRSQYVSGRWSVGLDMTCGQLVVQAVALRRPTPAQDQALRRWSRAHEGFLQASSERPRHAQRVTARLHLDHHDFITGLRTQQHLSGPGLNHLCLWKSGSVTLCSDTPRSQMVSLSRDQRQRLIAAATVGVWATAQVRSFISWIRGTRVQLQNEPALIREGWALRALGEWRAAQRLAAPGEVQELHPTWLHHPDCGWLDVPAWIHDLTPSPGPPELQRLLREAGRELQLRSSAAQMSGRSLPAPPRQAPDEQTRRAARALGWKSAPTSQDAQESP